MPVRPPALALLILPAPLPSLALVLALALALSASPVRSLCLRARFADWASQARMPRVLALWGGRACSCMPLMMAFRAKEPSLSVGSEIRPVYYTVGAMVVTSVFRYPCVCCVGMYVPTWSRYLRSKCLSKGPNGLFRTLSSTIFFEHDPFRSRRAFELMSVIDGPGGSLTFA